MADTLDLNKDFAEVLEKYNQPNHGGWENSNQRRVLKYVDRHWIFPLDFLTLLQWLEDEDDE